MTTRGSSPSTTSLGALLWTTLVLLLGYFIGNSVKDTYLIPAVIVVS